MLTVFFTVLEMSLTASIVILVVMLARMLLSKAPKKYAYLLWAVVAFRLCVPFSFESEISIFNTDAIPSFDVETSITETVSGTASAATSETSEEISVPSTPATPNEGTVSTPVTPPVSTPRPEVSYPAPEVSYPTPEVSSPTVEIPEVPEVSVPTVETPVVPPVETPVQTPAPSTDWQHTLGVVLASVWALGIVCMLGCGIVSYVKLKKRLQNAVLLYDNVYGSDRIGSPFALGFFRPRIYIPFGMNEESTSYILAHERYHLKRLDHLVKPLSFLILCVHWFNPLCWLAFNRMSLDMELSCDERVLKQYGDENMKKKYSKTLLDFATDNRYPTPAPISFSEGAGAKTRIKHALYWKKPRFWVSAIALVLCAVVLVACAANAVSKNPSDETSEDEGPARIIDFGDTPYQFTFTSNGDGTCVITDIKTDFDRTEKFNLIIPETSPDGDKVVEVDMSVLGDYKDVFNVPGALTKETFEAIVSRIRTSEFKGENSVDAEDAADIVGSFYGRPHGQPSAEHADEFSYVVIEPHIAVEEASCISTYLTDCIGYTAEDCYADCLAVLELDTSKEIAALLAESAFRFFYHDASNIQKVILPHAEINILQGETELSYELNDGTPFVPAYENPVSIGYLTDDVDLMDSNTLHFAEKNTDPAETIMLTTGETVTALCFFALDSTDGKTFSVEQVLFSGAKLTDAQTMVIDTYISETFPNRGIGFYGSDDKMHYYAINWSGLDGSLSLSEITDRIDFPLSLSIRNATEEDKHNDTYLHFESPGLTVPYDFVITTNQTLAGLNVCKFNVADDFSHYTAEPFDTHLGTFSPQTPLHLTVDPESITCFYGISFKDDSGTLRYFAIFENEIDETISLIEITDQMKKDGQTNGETVIESFETEDGTLYLVDVEDFYHDRLYLIKDDGTRVDIREQRLFSYLAFSEDQSKLIWNDYEWEWNAAVCVYDLASQTLTVQPMDDLGISRTPSYMAWLDNRYFLFVSQYDMGTITHGGDLYVYDTETHLYRLLFDVERVGPRELMIHSFVTDGQNITLRAEVYDYDTDLYVDWEYTVTAVSVYEMIKYGNSVTLGIDDGELLQKPPQIPNGETLIASFQLEDGYLYHTEDSDHNHVLRIMRYDGTVTEIDKRSYITNVCLNYHRDMLIWNDFSGEYNATVWIYDIDTGVLTEQPMDDLGEDYTPSFMSWYDHRYFLFISQFDHGSIVRGGDVYVYDTETHEYRMIIDAQDRLMFTSLDEYLYAVNYNEENDSYTEMFYTVYADLRELFENDQPLIVRAEDCREYVAPLDCPVEVVPTDKEPSIKFDGDTAEVFEFTFTKDVNGFAIVKIDTGVAYDVTVDPLGEPTDYQAGDKLVYSMYLNDISDSRGFVLIGEDGKLHYYALRGPDMAGFSSDYSAVEVTNHPLLTVDGEIPDFNP